MINETRLFMKSEVQKFLVSFIDQSPPPQQEALKRFIHEPMFTERILGVIGNNRSKDSACILSPDLVSWAQDYAFLKVTFLGIESQLLLHDVLVYNLVNICFSLPSYLSIVITYFVHLARHSFRRYFGSKNLFRKAFLDERFRCKD